MINTIPQILSMILKSALLMNLRKNVAIKITDTKAKVSAISNTKMLSSKFLSIKGVIISPKNRIALGFERLTNIPFNIKANALWACIVDSVLFKSTFGFALKSKR